jgi:hypothetical protein
MLAQFRKPRHRTVSKRQRSVPFDFYDMVGSLRVDHDSAMTAVIFVPTPLLPTENQAAGALTLHLTGARSIRSPAARCSPITSLQSTTINEVKAQFNISLRRHPERYGRTGTEH